MIVRDVCVFGWHSRPERIHCHMQHDGFYQTMLHKDEPFVFPCKVAIVTEYCFMGISLFLVILDTEPKVSF